MGVVVVDRNIDVHIRSVRKKLGDAAQLIQTIRSVGYRILDN
jgi:two-component system phosphate regulon response regulator PhoB